jgi:hypothetical protein
MHNYQETLLNIPCAGRKPVVSLVLGVGLAAICFCLPGCSESSSSQAPRVDVTNPSSSVPSSSVPGTPAQPGQRSSQPTPNRAVDRSGTYAGTATPFNTGGGACIATRTVSGFRVQGTAVRFGQFRGTIAADNGLQMTFREQWIVGQFDGPTFSGQWDIPNRTRGRWVGPNCSFMLSLQRVGP